MNCEWPSNRVRKKFIKYFIDKHGHSFIPSSLVIPKDDSTLLFANAGMNQFKNILLGKVSPLSPLYTLKRAVNSQKCIRAGGKHNDLDDAGKDTYHHTFFEMLGNWSFGDYFKKEAIEFAYDLLTNIFKLDKDRLYVTYFKGSEKLNLVVDNETKEIWENYLPQSKILPFGMAENFWEMGETGPCGPCTEIHYDLIGGRDAADLVNKGNPEVIELWNIVFIQFDRMKDGSLNNLPLSHVDTGMGFERVVSILQNKKSNYDTDLFSPIFEAIKTVTNFEQEYKGKVGMSEDALIDNSYRIVADHVRCLCVAISDGAIPDKTGRGYVLRRILRRAVRAGKMFFKANYNPFLYKLVPTIANIYKGVFDGISEKQQVIQRIIKEEEESFLLTLEKGDKYLIKIIKSLKATNQSIISGREAFFLYSSYGFPVDLTAQVAEEKGFSVDFEGFSKAKERDRLLSRRAGVPRGKSDLSLSTKDVEFLRENKVQPTDFSLQYSLDVEFDAKVVAIKGFEGFEDKAYVEDKTWGLILDKTSFYAESGGQIFDVGLIESNEAEIEVIDTQIIGGFVLHIGLVIRGKFIVGEKVTCLVDYTRRRKIMPNHTMTHILNHSLRNVCAEELEQKGSRVLPEKLTFDFNSNPLSVSQIELVETLSKSAIDKNLVVYSENVPFEKAMKIRGIRAVFGEAYPEPVRVVSIGKPIKEILENPLDESLTNFSIELCGGTHLINTNEAKAFCIISEVGIGKGIRRLICLTATEAQNAIKRGDLLLDEFLKAKNMEHANLKSFLNKPITTNEAPVPLLTVWKIEKIREELRQTLKCLDKAEEVNAERKFLNSFKEVLMEISRKVPEMDENESKLQKIYENDQTPVETKITKSWSEKAVVVFSVEKAGPKLLKKAIDLMQKHSDSENLMALCLFDDKKGSLKIIAKCFVKKSASESPDELLKENSKSFDAAEWIRLTMKRLGGKGNGNAASAQGQAPYFSGAEEVVDEIRSFCD